MVSAQKPGQSNKNVTDDSNKIVFFAGYSHHHINDAWNKRPDNGWHFKSNKIIFVSKAKK